MPYPNEHSARLQPPGRYDTFRRTDGGTLYGKIKLPSTIAVIWGKLTEASDSADSPIAQALQFPTKKWTVAGAREWLKVNKIKVLAFEPAIALKAKEARMGGRRNDSEQIQEYFDCRDVGLKVDAEKGIIRGVKVLGLESKNGRIYTESAIRTAAHLYSEAKVNIDHPEGNPNGPRKYAERLGELRNPQPRADGLFGDLHFNPRHPMGERLVWDAEHMPQNLGLSHNVEARMNRKNGKHVVEAILRVQSVDLVADSATTRGLFESAEENAEEGVVGDKVATEKREKLLREINRAAQDLLYEVMDNSELTVAAKKARLLAILDDWETQLTSATGEVSTEEESAVEMKTLTLEDLKSNRPDLHKAIATEALTEQAQSEEAKAKDAEVKGLKEKVTAYEAEEAARKRLTEIDAMIQEAKLPKEVATDELLKPIRESSSIEDATRLLEAVQFAVAKVAGNINPRSTEQGRADGQETEGDVPPTDGKSWAKAVRK